jgi:hypothetical protein
MEILGPQANPLAIRSVRESFTHEPLDHSKQSIRLLNVKTNASADGLLQCTIVQSTISANYNCLSYTWGEATRCYDILINGKVMSVRQNLFDFLCEVRRTKRFNLRLWIDAIWSVNRFVQHVLH